MESFGRLCTECRFFGETWTETTVGLPGRIDYKVKELTCGVGNADDENAYSGNYVMSGVTVSADGKTFTLTNTLKWSAMKVSQEWDEDDTTTLSGVGLEGAKFELKKGDTVIATGTSGATGKIAWTAQKISEDSDETYDLYSLDGSYTIHETKAPEGYVRHKDWTVTFNKGLLTTLDGKECKWFKRKWCCTYSWKQEIVLTAINRRNRNLLVYDRWNASHGSSRVDLI